MPVFRLPLEVFDQLIVENMALRVFLSLQADLGRAHHVAAHPAGLRVAHAVLSRADALVPLVLLLPAVVLQEHVVQDAAREEDVVDVRAAGERDAAAEDTVRAFIMIPNVHSTSFRADSPLEAKRFDQKSDACFATACKQRHWW